jgi:uncharacterized cupin superfamily protein
VKYARIRADADGSSHFEDVEPPTELTAYVPGHSMEVTTPEPARRVQFTRWPPGQFQPWHASPRRHFTITLSGEFEVTVSDGERRRFRAGDVYIGEDTTGQGHESRSVGETDWVAAIVSLED